MLTRTAFLTGVTALCVLLVAPPAWADPDFFSGQAECGSEGGPGCGVSAGSGSRSPGSPGTSGGAAPQTPDTPGGGAGASAEAEPSCDEVAPGELDCEGAFAEAGIPGGGAAVDPAALADSARDTLRLPQPGIATSPAAGAPVLVRVPVWLWIDDATWRPETARADVAGGWVSVTAAPSTARWSMGDGTAVACDGPGRPFRPGTDDAAAASPECGHTYARSSSGRPDGRYALGLDVVWEVAWETSEGDEGVLAPLVTSSAVSVEVVESQGLVTATG